MPVLFCEPNAPFFRPFRVKGVLSEDRTGGWMVGQLGLDAFYKDFLEGRNRWSQTNCGFDLAKYRGTHITLYPTQSVDYIFWFDTDYGQFNEFKTLVQHIHPAILLNSPHTTVVLSKETRGTYRPKRVFIPPPTIFGNKWSTQSDWAGRGLAVFAVSVIDFRYPWVHPGTNFEENRPYSMYDYTSNKGIARKIIKNETDKWKLADMWWNCKVGSTEKRADVWYAQWPGWSDDKAPLDATVYDAVALGPFVKKQQFSECQIVLTYRSHWWWGGDILSLPERVCNPATGAPQKSLKGGVPCDPSLYINKADIDKSGYIKPEKWRQLTEEPTETSGFSAALRNAQFEEEETSSTLQPEETSEDDSESSEGSRVSGRGLDRRRVRDLLRLRFKLKELKRIKNWSD